MDEHKQSPNPDRHSSGPQWDSVLRNAGLGGVIVLMIWVAFNVELPSIDKLQSAIEDLGWVGAFAFVLLYAAVAVTPIPVTIMAVTGGLLFGVIGGSLLSIVGVLLGCWAAYWLARALGHHTVRKLLGSYADKVERNLENAGFQAVCILRLLPGIPYWPVNYGSGAFGINQRTFLVASVVSTIPGQVSLVAIGALIAEQTLIHGIVLACAWVLVAGMTIWAYRAWRGTAKHQLPGS